MLNQAEDCRYCFNCHFGPIKDAYDYSIFGKGAELIYDSTQVGLGVSRLKFCAFCYPNCQRLQYCLRCHSSSDLFGCAGLRNKQYCILNKQYSKEEYEKLVPKIIEHMSEMPYISRMQKSKCKMQNHNLLNPKSEIRNPKQIQNSKFKTREIVYRYGEFFPPELSPFAYNETIAQEYFPLTKEQAIAQGYRWKDPEKRDYQIDIKTEDLPDHIKDAPDDIAGKIIECANYRNSKSEILNPKQIPNPKSQIPNTQFSNCTTAFKIIPQELEFYRKMQLPLPRYCPNCRHFQRIQQRNPLCLWQRQCQCAGVKSSNGLYANTIEHFHGTNPCPNKFETTYSPDRPEIVYCKECYQREVV